MNNLHKERKQLLNRVESTFEAPLIVLGFIWLVLLVAELVYGLTPFLENLGWVIWVIFILDFVIKLILAPDKFVFLKSNVLTIISLAVPALRMFRIFRIIRLLRYTRSLRLVKVIGSLNRGMRALSATMKKRAFGYVIILTLIVILAGAAGMYAFENEVPGGLNTYGTALWWTTMIITTLGSEYWPKSPEGRILCIVLALYAFAVFGYITATIATFFIGKDTIDEKTDTRNTATIDDLRKEIQGLKKMIEEISNRP